MTDRPALESEIEVTPEMIVAGVEAADLISYEWGETPEVTLVSRVFRAMDAVRSDSPPRRARSERKARRGKRSLSIPQS